MSRIIVKKRLLPHLEAELDIELVPGQLTVLCGENGIGKSTLLSFLYHQSDKTVFCPQKPLEHFFDRPLGKFRSLLLASSSQVERKIFDDFWESSNLSGKSDRMLSHLSGGEAQFLKLLIHAAAPGEKFFFDEPGQYLDPEKKKLAASLFTELLKRDRSVLLVEHDERWLPKETEVTRLELRQGILQKGESWTI